MLAGRRALRELAEMEPAMSLTRLQLVGEWAFMTLSFILLALKLTEKSNFL